MSDRMGLDGVKIIWKSILDGNFAQKEMQKFGNVAELFCNRKYRASFRFWHYRQTYFDIFLIKNN